MIDDECCQCSITFPLSVHYSAQLTLTGASERENSREGSSSRVAYLPTSRGPMQDLPRRFTIRPPPNGDI